MFDPKKYPLLATINSPADLRALSLEQLPTLCRELREDILDELAANPGHLASSLGVVELTVALHYTFDTPNDRLVWDVGHQAYGHKILTGRRDAFCTNRKLGGLRPFPSPLESPYDTFAAGHASNSISAALGMSLAALQQGEDDRHVVAIIGDGAMSGGLAFEGLNNVSNIPNNMLIVLNDNNMSIDRAVGGMKQLLGHLHTSPFYNRVRWGIARRLEHWGWIGDNGKRRIIRFNNSLKSLFTGQQNVFEGMDIRYFGPTDGHDVVQLVHTLRRIKDMRGPKMLHIHTVKGKGYQSAEADPTVWHAPGQFDRQSGGRSCQSDATPRPPKFQDVFGHTLLELAQQNPRIIGVTPAMPTGCSMSILMKAMPDRAYDVGIAEGHAVTFAAGMAKDGLIPFCNIYSSFAQRAYDNIIHDAALLGLPVVICLDRAGIVGEDGATHHGLFDIAALRPVPGVTIASPYDECELRRLMFTAQQPGMGVFVIRYPRGAGRRTDWQCPLEPIEVGKGRLISDGDDPVALLTFGPIGNVGADAVRTLAETTGRRVAHYDMRFAKPLDEPLLLHIASRHQRVVTLEDGIRAGGFGSAVMEFYADRGLAVPVQRLGVADHFVEHGKPAELYHAEGIDAEAVLRALSATA